MHCLKLTMSLILIGASLYFLPCSSAQELNCSVSQEAHGRTTYRIPDFYQTSCEFSWTSNAVLAMHEEEKDGKVLFKNETTLTTQTCMETVFYKRDCISEGIVRTATCNATCTGPAGIVGKKGSHTHYIVISVVILALVVITGVAVWYHKIRVRARGSTHTCQVV